MSRFRLRPPGLLRSLRSIAALAAAVFILSFSAALPHEGHDHADDARSVPAASTYPRVAAQSEQYEIVGILRNGRLSLYLDHFASNEPVTDAAIKVTIGDAEPVDAEPAENGTYVVSSPQLTGTGS